MITDPRVPKLKSFIEKALETRKYHADKLKDHPKWTIKDSARTLGRSMGSVSEDLLVASWYRTHSNKIEKFDYMADALIWIRKMKKDRFINE